MSIHEYEREAAGWLGITEAAATLGVTRLLVVLAMQRGQLQFSEIDGRRLTTLAWLQKWRHDEPLPKMGT